MPMRKILEPADTIIITALFKELPIELPIPVYFCGIGKVNATITTMRIINQIKPKTILNYGTAGSVNNNINGLVRVGSLLQRDIDLRALGYDLGETPFEENTNILELDLEIARIAGLKVVSCSTGDQFVDARPELESDIVDMEAYAIAKACIQNNVDFCCWKYISDHADDDASNDWESNMGLGAEKFLSLLSQTIVE